MQKARVAEKEEGGFIVGLLALVGPVVVILIVSTALNDDN